MTNDKVIDKLRKLIAHQESAEKIGSMEEAEAFAAKISQLLMEHKLEMAEVSANVQIEEDVNGDWIDFDSWNMTFSRRYDFLMINLANTVAEANYCRVIGSSGTNRFRLIGKPTDKAVAQYLFMILHRTANEMAETNYRKIYYAFKKVGREHEMKSYKKSFLQGFNDAIKERLKIQRAEVSQENALVLRNAMIPVHDWVSKNLKLTYTSSSGRGSSNSYGKSHGYAAGQSVAMNRGVAGTSVKRLGS